MNIAFILSLVLKNRGRLMSISNIGQNIATYGIQIGKDTPSIFNSSKVDANSIEYREADKSTVPEKRELFANMIARVSSSDQNSQALLDDFSKPSNSGLLLGGLPDLSDHESLNRLNKVNELFLVEQKKFENQKTDLINQGKMSGDSPQKILEDIVGLYDSQSEFFQKGVGWKGEVFSFAASSEVVDVRV